MLSPNSGDRVVLLPCDREIIELAGITEKEYREFVRHCRFNSKIRPGTPVAIGLDLILLQIGISLVLAAAAYLLTPKPKGRQAANARLETRQVDGQDIVRGSRIAPKAGFDQLQNVVEMGSVIPLVFANREVIKDQTYGGVRVNTNLLWSQVLSLGGDQLLRSVFLLGEGDNRADSMEIDPSQFAFGNNLLGSYDLAQGSNQSRISIYYNKDGGRLVSADYIAGRIAANDPGNAETAGGSDVFQVRGPGATYGPNFCYAYKPSTQTNFGLYGWVGNGVCYKTNPSLRPAWSPSLLPTGRDDRLKIACTNDGQEEVARMKDQYVFPGLSGIVSGGGAVNVGDVINYTLQSGLSKSDEFIFNVTGPNIVGQSQSRLSSNDANAAVASRQASFDENIVQGELYRIGSALAVCTSRTNKPFGSAADQASQGVNASFEVVRAGQVSGNINSNGSATQYAQIFRVAIGTFVTEQPCQVLEVGLRSTLGVQIQGQTNMRERFSDYGSIDTASCLAHNGNNIGTNTTLVTQNFRAGTITTPETRYSFFRIRYRVGGSGDAYTELPQLFGVRSDTNSPVYNFIRFEMPSINRWEFELEPVSGWEIRSGGAVGSLEVLDPKVEADEEDPDGFTRVATGGPVTVRYNGVAVSRSQQVFEIPNTHAVEPKLWQDLNSRAGAWGRLAEAFMTNEVTSSLGGNPEHDIVYINTILPNAVPPDYADMALLGMNIRASREFANLAQFSAYINKGIAGVHDFPSVYRELLTNTRWGVGEILSPKQIDEPSFTAMTAWTRKRRYFYDGVISEKLNLRAWGTEMARNFLLDLVMRNGQFYLQPLMEFDAAEPITGLFTAGNIIEGSFQLNYLTRTNANHHGCQSAGAKKSAAPTPPTKVYSRWYVRSLFGRALCRLTLHWSRST